jgi:hypothetical protein
VQETVSIASVVFVILALLPTGIAASSNRAGPTLLVLGLNILSIFGLFLLVVPGALLWFVALFVGMWASNQARRDRQHKELLRAISPQAVALDAGPRWSPTRDAILLFGIILLIGLFALMSKT